MRAGASAPGFRLDEGNAQAVAGLCRRLDGIPLALELAATRVRTLGVHELLARLDDRFRLLVTGHRDAPPRQQTLWAVIDWSWELLTEPERLVLRRLAVAADGCGLHAAEAICAEDDLDVLGLLARLVDRSLVVVADGPDGPRYRLLESVAAYGLQRLREAGESGELRRAAPPLLHRSRRTGGTPPSRPRPAVLAQAPGRRDRQPARRPGLRAQRQRRRRPPDGQRPGLVLVPARPADRSTARAGGRPLPSAADPLPPGPRPRPGGAVSPPSPESAAGIPPRRLPAASTTPPSGPRWSGSTPSSRLISVTHPWARPWSAGRWRASGRSATSGESRRP